MKNEIYSFIPWGPKCVSVCCTRCSCIVTWIIVAKHAITQPRHSVVVTRYIITSIDRAATAEWEREREKKWRRNSRKKKSRSPKFRIDDRNRWLRLVAILLPIKIHCNYVANEQSNNRIQPRLHRCVQSFRAVMLFLMQCDSIKPNSHSHSHALVHALEQRWRTSACVCELRVQSLCSGTSGPFTHSAPIFIIALF